MSISKVQGSGQRILIVDDTVLLSSTMKRILESWGFVVELAFNGEEGVKKFTERKFDLIIMDVNMPVMNGFQATQAIRAIEAKEDLTRTPIVGNTSEPSCSEKGIEAGMDACNAKMSGMEPLARVVREFILNRHKENP